MAADRILTTHVGSLIRPPELVAYLKPLLDGQPYDEARACRPYRFRGSGRASIGVTSPATGATVEPVTAPLDRIERRRSIDMRLPNPQQVQVGAVDDHHTHDGPLLI